MKWCNTASKALNSLRKGYLLDSGNVNTVFHEDSCVRTVNGACSSPHLDLMKLRDTICSSCWSEKETQIHSLCMHVRHYTCGK